MRRRLAPGRPYVGLALREATPDGTPFGPRTGRVGGAVGTAAATHALIGLVLWGLARLPPSAQPSTPVAASSSIGPFLFTSRDGEGGGRSGGGNRSPDPVALLRTQGADAIAVPVAPRPAFETPDSIAPERDAAPVLPVQPMDAGQLPQVGAVDGVPGPPTLARGPGDGDIGTRPGSDRGIGGGAPGNQTGERPYGIGNGVTPPELIHRTQPRYTPEAVRAKLQGAAVLTAVVGSDGMLRDIRVARSLDATWGLDQEAIACVRQWRFRPGTRHGTPVAVYVTIEVAFTLR